jgi:hypothetical protein
MADLRALKTVHQDAPTSGSVTLQCLAVKAGIPALTALEDASCYLEGVLTLLGDIAVESAENTSALYAILSSASIAKALLDSVVSSTYQADKV